MISKLIPSSTVLKQTIERFPLPALFSAIAFLIVFLFGGDADDKNVLGQAFLFCIFGFFFTVLTKLVRENIGLPKNKHILLLLSGFGFYAFVVTFNDDISQIFYLIAIILLAFMVVPFLQKNPLKTPENDLFWSYNNSFWLGIIGAFFASVVLFAGISLAFIGITFLLFKIPPDLYFRVWMFAAFLFAPLYALSTIPKSISSIDLRLERSCLFIAKWVLIPLTLLYISILYAYFAKIILIWDFPSNRVALISGGFCFLAIITYMASWPLKSTQGKVLDFFYKNLFKMLLLPLGMMAFSLYLRIEDYGFTQQRYWGVIACLWMVITSLYFVFSKQKYLKVPPLILIALLILISVGPLTPSNVSVKSQNNRLMKIVDAHHLLDPDKRDVKSITFEDNKEISDLIRYLHHKENTKALPKEIRQRAKHQNIASYHEVLGLSEVRRNAKKSDEHVSGRIPFHINTRVYEQNLVLSLKGYDYLIPSNNNITLHSHRENSWAEKKVSASLEMKMRIEGKSIIFSSYGRQDLVFDLSKIIASNLDKNKNEEGPYTLVQGNSDWKVKLLIYNISGNKWSDTNETFINYIRLRALIKEGDY